MTADGLAHEVRDELGLGRLLPLAGPAAGGWLAERAAAGALRPVQDAVPGALLTALRIGLAEPAAHDWRAARAACPAAPPSALPPGPLRIAADVEAPAGRPLPDTTAALRAALAGAAAGLGLDVAVVDLRVTALLDAAPAPEAVPEPVAAPRDPVLGVPGVLTATAHRLAGAVRLDVTVSRGRPLPAVVRELLAAGPADAVLVTAIR